MSILFDRRYSVTIGQLGQQGTEITGLRASFRVEKKRASKNPNTMTLDLYNTNKSTAALAQQKDAAIVLKAGYAGDVTLPVLYSGDIFTAYQSRRAADHILHIECGTAVQKLKTSRIKISKSGGGSMKDALTDALKQLGLPVKNLSLEKIVDFLFDNGISVEGDAKSIMDQITKSLNSDWWIDDGEVNVIPRTDATNEIAFVLNKNTGLVGIPAKARVDIGTKENEKDKEGWNFRALLNASIRPGRLCQIESEFTERKVFVAEAVNCTYTCDTHGQEWYVDTEGVIR